MGSRAKKNAPNVIEPAFISKISKFFFIALILEGSHFLLVFVGQSLLPSLESRFFLALQLVESHQNPDASEFSTRSAGVAP